MTYKTKKIVVLDTNLFLHYKRPDQLNWKALQSADIELVVPAVVIRELEKAKNFGSSSRLKKRAAETITWLSKLMDQGFEVELRNGLKLKFETTEPAIDFAEHALVRELQDDVLIAGLISLSTTISGRPLMATADLGVKSKARQRGFEVFAPLETDKLPEEPDTRDQELVELRKENLQFKNRQPRLKIAFAKGEVRVNHLPLISNPTPALATLDTVKQRHPILNAPNVLPESRRAAYNEKLQKFYTDFEKYRNRVEKLRMLARCRVELQFVLFNEGTALATDIDVVLTFPEGVFVLKDLKLFEEPKTPVAPEKPTISIMGGSILDAHNFGRPELSSFSPPAGLFPRQTLNWSIEVDRNIAHFRLDRLKPEFDWPLQTLWLQFANEDALLSTTVHADVSASESSGRVSHQLHIIVG